MDLFAIPATLSFFLLCAIAAHRNVALFVSVYLTFALFNDFIILRNFRGSDAVASLMIQAWREIFILIALSVYLRSKAAGTTIKLDPPILGVLAIVGYGIAVAIWNGDPVGDIYSTTRRFAAPFIFATLIFSAVPLARVGVTSIWRWSLFCSVLFSLYAIYIEIAVGEDYRDLWFFDFVASTKTSMNLDERLVEYQFFRDGDLRVSSFLISSVEYSLYAGMFALVGVIGFLKSAPKLSALYFALIAGINLYSTYETETRAGLLIFFGGLALYAMHSVIRLRHRESVTFVLIALAAVVIVYTAQSSFDASVAGRAQQYSALMSEFRVFGYGTGTIFNNAPTYKDSLYLSVTNSFGLISIVVFFWMWRAHRKALALFKAPELARDERILFDSLAVTLQILAFVFAFHYFIGGVSYIFAVFFSVMAIARLDGLGRKESVT